MKVKIIKDFYGAEDGINTKLYKADEVVEVEKEFGDHIIDQGYAEFDDGKETKVVKPAEIKSKTTKKGKKE